MTLLDIQGLKAGYGTTDIIRNVNFTLEEGEILGIIGESGSGKTTILKSIIRNPSHKIDVMDGNIFFQGKDLLSLSQKEMQKVRGSQIGYVFQNPATTFNPLRKIMYQFLDLVRSHRPTVDEKEFLSQAARIIESFGLQDSKRVLNSYPWQLSGGMLQRISIAMALILKPDMILADEPTSALDVVIQKKVLHEISSLTKEGIGIIIVTHDMGVISEITQKALVIYKGNVLEAGKSREILDNPIHPYTKALLKAVPRLGGELPEPLSTENFCYNGLDEFVNTQDHYVNTVRV